MDQQIENLEDLGGANLVFLSKDPEASGKIDIDNRAMGRAYYSLAKIYYDKADLQSAYINFEKALECGERPKDNFAILKTLGFLIKICSEQLENEKANKYILLAEEIVDQLSTTLGSLTSEYFYNAAIVHTYKGEFEKADENFNMALKKSREENEPEFLAKCLLALATNYYQLKKHEEALTYLNHLDQVLTIIDKDFLSGSMYNLFGKVYLELGEIEKSLEHFTSASLTLQVKKCWNLQGYLLLWKGKVYKKLGNFDRSLFLYELAKESIDKNVFKRLEEILEHEIQDVNDSSVDLYLDRSNRKVTEKHLGSIDFKHRFVLLEILFLLAKSRGSYYDKEDLAKLIWKDEYNPLIHDKLIYTSISRLRKLIEPKSEGSKRKYIIRGKDGYAFDPDVKIRFQAETKRELHSTIANVELNTLV